MGFPFGHLKQRVSDSTKNLRQTVQKATIICEVNLLYYF